MIEQRKIVETSELVPVPSPLGYITYGKDGRMTTPPFPFHPDGRISFNMLVWERVQ